MVDMLTRLRRNLVDAEGDRRAPYVDTVGKTTIGVGHNLTDRGISQAVRDLLLEEDIATALSDLDRALPWWRELAPVRQAALAELAFNMGIGTPRRGLLSFKRTLEHLQFGRYQAAADHLLRSKWARQVGPRRAGRIERMIRVAL